MVKFITKKSYKTKVQNNYTKEKWIKKSQRDFQISHC